jgi:branched-chain amino acid transport system permease protein
MSWVLSGDLIVIVVLGGMGSVFGPLLGALAFLGLEEVLKPLTEHWMISFGLCIVGMTLMGATGLVGVLAKVFSHSSNAQSFRPKGGL